MAVFFALGYIVYEFALPCPPRGVLDWLGIHATMVGLGASLTAISLVWKAVGPEPRRMRGGEAENGESA
ncbi:MAG: hypothetical protein R3D98_10885 [Candidatus Krumholzibacteriia bacterium]